ncbi:hypothetical protein DICVIV_13620 [Dictyocaulus viviparus]|uniref:Uncharacterized protein n=1 Tax=Dictyocaulus viviparus TaxID=29172 RepID=A0A0D8X9H5_DICVI|nr:hypothetical protein DICVIV_13620 [Dictyocaulus viviparus]
MGFFSSLSQILGVGRRKVNVIVVGLDNSGKIYGFCMIFVVYYHTLNTHKYQCKNLGKYRNLWETYYISLQAAIFVVDSTDRLRMAVARDELWMSLDHKDVSERPVSTFQYFRSL